MKIFVTGNQQFGRKGAIKKYNRPFVDVMAMDTHLIKTWNSVVSHDDHVYVLGNFAWDPITADEIIGELNGTIYLIKGEFDKSSSEVAELHEYKLNICPFDIYTDDINEICLSYWPLSEWKGKKKGYHLVTSFDGAKYKSNHKTNIINVSCDYWSFKPVEIKKIKDFFIDINSK